MFGDKQFVAALNEGVTRTLLFENPNFAFRGKPAPRDYGEYLAMADSHARGFGMDAFQAFLGFGPDRDPKGIDVPEELRHIRAAPEEFARRMESLDPICSVGLTYKGPFSEVVDGWPGGVGDCLMHLHESLLGSEANNEIIARIGRCTEEAVGAAKILERHADFLVISEPSGSNNHIGPHHFERYVLPSYRDIAASTSIPVVVHIPGRVLKQIPLLKGSGVKGLMCGGEEGLPNVLNAVGCAMPVFGNVDEKLFYNGATVADVRAEFGRCASAYDDGPWVVHTSFWMPWNADPGKVGYLSRLVTEYSGGLRIKVV